MTDHEETEDQDCVQEGLENIVKKAKEEKKYEAWAAQAVQEMYDSGVPGAYFFGAVEAAQEASGVKNTRIFQNNILDWYLDAKRYWFRHREYNERMSETIAMAETFKYLFRRANGESIQYRKNTDSGR